MKMISLNIKDLFPPRVYNIESTNMKIYLQ